MAETGGGGTVIFSSDAVNDTFIMEMVTVSPYTEYTATVTASTVGGTSDAASSESVRSPETGACINKTCKFKESHAVALYIKCILNLDSFLSAVHKGMICTYIS